MFARQVSEIPRQRNARRRPIPFTFYVACVATYWPGRVRFSLCSFLIDQPCYEPIRLASRPGEGSLVRSHIRVGARNWLIPARFAFDFDFIVGPVLEDPLTRPSGSWNTTKRPPIEIRYLESRARGWTRFSIRYFRFTSPVDRVRQSTIVHGRYVRNGWRKYSNSYRGKLLYAYCTC